MATDSAHSGVDTSQLPRENGLVPAPGASRKQLARTLTAAYAGGLLSQETFESRVDHVLKARLIDPLRIIGDLNLRSAARMPKTKLMRAAAIRMRVANEGAHAETRPRLLALDWNGGNDELLLGRYYRCDLVFSNRNVSRFHARLLFRDGSWILHDLESTNGTFVNGQRVRRCELHPGDRLLLGDETLTVD